MPLISPEYRTQLIEGFAAHAPLRIKRISSALVGLPMRREILACGVIFIHVPKNAGTTISTQLYGRHIGHRTAQFYQNCDHAYYASKPSFALFRCPVERFKSAYKFALAGGTPNVPASPIVTEFARSFETETHCAAFIAELAPTERDRLDPVFKSQSHYVCDGNGAVSVNALFDLKKVAGTQFEFASKTLDMSKTQNRTERSEGTLQGDAADLHSAIHAAYTDDFKLKAHTL